MKKNSDVLHLYMKIKNNINFWGVLYKRKLLFFCLVLLVFCSTFLLNTKLLKSEKKISNILITSKHLIFQESDLTILKDKEFQKSVFEKIFTREITEYNKLIKLRENLKYYFSNVKTEISRNKHELSISVEANNVKLAYLTGHAIALEFIKEKIKELKNYEIKDMENIDESIKNKKRLLFELERKLLSFPQKDMAIEIDEKLKIKMDDVLDKNIIDFTEENKEIDEQIYEIDKVFALKDNGSPINYLNKKIMFSDFKLIELNDELFDLEFKRFFIMLAEDNQAALVAQNESRIAQIKLELVDLIKELVRIDLDPEGEAKVALFVKRLFLNVRKDVMSSIKLRQYGGIETFSNRQERYIVFRNQKKRLIYAIHELVHQKKVSDIGIRGDEIKNNFEIVESQSLNLQWAMNNKNKLDYVLSSIFGLCFSVLCCFINVDYKRK